MINYLLDLLPDDCLLLLLIPTCHICATTVQSFPVKLDKLLLAPPLPHVNQNAQNNVVCFRLYL